MAVNWNYYGYEKEQYERCREQIAQNNIRHTQILSAWFGCLMLLLTGLSVFGYLNRTLLFLYISFAILSMLIFGLVNTQPNPPVRTSEIMILLLLSFGMAAAVGSDERLRYIALLFPVVVAVAYVLTVIKMAFLLVGSMAVVLASLLLRQPVSEISGELFSVIVAISLALVLHPAFQKQWMIRFMTRLKNAELRLELDLQSSFDPMTGLLTRGRFLQIANEVLANQEEGYRAVCIIDLDRFKRINDTYGHQAGDKAIRTASALLMEELIRKMNVADLGEFQGLQASIGVTDAEGTDLETLYRYADLALYDTKKKGKNRVVYLKSDI